MIMTSYKNLMDGENTGIYPKKIPNFVPIINKYPKVDLKLSNFLAPQLISSSKLLLIRYKTCCIM